MGDSWVIPTVTSLTEHSVHIFETNSGIDLKSKFCGSSSQLCNYLTFESRPIFTRKEHSSF